jgi:hypothetical protein
MPEEERERIRQQEEINQRTFTWTNRYCSRTQIKKVVAALGREKKLLNTKDKKYRPHYKGIQYKFGENILEVILEKRRYNEEYNTANFFKLKKLDEDFEAYVNDIIKEIILADYHKRDFVRTDRDDHLMEIIQRQEQGDYLNIRKALVK